MNIQTIDYSYKNDKGHKVYEFYPDRKFDAEIVVCPWFGEVKNHLMLPAVFAICDQSNIKLLVLSSKDNIPLFSLYSHGVICITEEEVGVDSTRTESKNKCKYLESHSDKCYNPTYHRKEKYSRRGWDLLWHIYCKEVGHPCSIISQIPKVEHANLFIEVAKKKYFGNDERWSFFRSLLKYEYSFVTEFYKEYIKKYNIYFLDDHIECHENLVNDLDIDDSPKIFSYLKNGKKQAHNVLNQGKCFSLDSSACRRRAGMEYILSDIMGEALNCAIKEVGPQKIYNFDYVFFAEKQLGAPKWPLHDYITLRGDINPKYSSSLTAMQILLSLKNNFSYVSQAGVSSILYFEPVNILYAEHQHWIHQIHDSNSDEFKKRPQQNLFKNEAVYGANDYRPIDNLVPSDISPEKLFRKTREYIEEYRDENYFKNLFLSYLNER